jgi:hypothetical protein
VHGTPVSLSSSVGVPHRHPSSAIHRALAWLSAVLAALLLLTGSGLAGAQSPDPAGNSGNSVPANGVAYETLAKLLENEATRSQLIEQLRTLARQQETPPAAAAAPPESAAGKEPSLLSSLPGMGAAARLLGSLSGTESTDKPAAPPQATAPAAPDTPQPSASQADPQRTLRHGEPADLPRQITSQTQLFLAGLAEGGATAVQTMQDMLKGNTSAVVRDHDWPSELSHLAIVALITLVSFLIFRRMATPVFHRMDVWVVRYVARSDNSQRVARLYSQTAAMVGALLVDLAAIVLAGTIGYGVALLFTGNQGELGNFERLFVNTFLAVEISRALIRVVFATRFKNLRLLPVPDETARYWNNWLERVASIAGYGVMLFVPIVGDVLTPEIAQVISLVLMLLVYGYAVRIIWKNRQNVREGIMARAKHSHSTAYGTLLRVIGRIWHVLAIAYFTLILVISQVNPLGAVSYLTYATLQTLLSIGIGALASAFLSAVLVRPFRLPDDVRTKLPQLEARLNSYVPAAVKWAKLIIASLVVLFVLDAWELFHAGEWITSEAGSQIVATVLRVSIVVLFAALVWTVVASIIEHRLSLDDPEQDGAPRRVKEPCWPCSATQR